ncbi:MAG: 16S rRNA (cytidine(1402)-2'-O)-methyltransferase [Zhengella sp.]|nr:16S rRNA (cytidine(1402)-2'-O)-methyltransferase [Notoacmeibacter sp.]MCC0025895.1 16S rRNA (cytidine(1402)-2'-O)-methyltransferase [Brucellaceae bacterium]
MIGQAAFEASALPAGLHLVATPIGNLADITIRALQALAGADIVACEDTRTSRVLLDRYGIRARTTAYHEHNAAVAGPKLIEAMASGRSVALVSDAGTPLLSDPGYRLVEETLAAGLPVTPLPGPSALLAALTASGLPTDAFFFAGFLPVKAGQKRTRLESLDAVPGTLVFYESPRRLAATLAAMAEIFGDRPAAVAREMTKAFEEVRRDSLPALAAHYGETGAPKGEIVICVAPPGEAAVPAAEDVDALLVELSAVMPASRAAAQAARQTGLPKQDLFARIVALKDRNGDG